MAGNLIQQGESTNIAGIEALSRLEVEILERRKDSKFYRQLPIIRSLFDVATCSSMVPRHLERHLEKFNKKESGRQKRLEILAQERRNRFLDVLPCLTEAEKGTKREIDLGIRGKAISNEMEKKMILLFRSREFQMRLFKENLWSVSQVVMNFDLSKMWVSFQLLQEYSAVAEAEQAANKLKEKLDYNTKLIRFLVAEQVYLKRVPIIEFVFDRQSLADGESHAHA